MKLALRHPSGLEIEFEGDTQAFDRFAKFLAGEVGSFLRGLSADGAGHSAQGQLGGGENPEGNQLEPPSRSLARDGSIDASAVHARWVEVGAVTEVERATVVAQAAIEAGLEGIDGEAMDRLYDTVGQPKPARFARVFFSAKEKGLLRNVKHGLYATTIQGENYARYGTQPTARSKRGASAAGTQGANGAGELPAGGDPTGD